MEKSDLCSQIPKEPPMPKDPFNSGTKVGGGQSSSKSDLGGQLPKEPAMPKNPFGK